MDRIQTFDKTVEKSDSNVDSIIEKGTINDIDELENLYDNLNDYFKLGTNYPGWAKGIYPIRETAVKGIQPETAYNQIIWGTEADYKDIIVIHTFVVLPKYMKNGVGEKLMDFAKIYSIEQEIKTIRLDVSIHNTPAISLYEKCGCKYVGTVDLGLNIPELVWFKLYEIVL